ncbi:uncharacterized protein si:dkeyp-110g5.4 [Puntigrus tetrazona]|uniref:uncharacterized protein si:dkeyp-110g5.4 n=1 Tax=Puntigrus tetrazona TaxID=1606681 RepID=UPI001C8ABC05|nr:uncharacterized protein si:dkeyp-110g5.4 [Puntigrus tetrazona]XP_043103780.1 uncharacterized protein si:dkeyp-110g5.4 [Puntigrus tetrazona]XP_043103781.1 uncharacterized protein si:dkeyp-110g5.4 [Puntigrus tetrazona]
MENIVVYIPKEACVKNMPLQSLSRSTARKISVALFPHGSEKQMLQTVTWIGPVELREKEVAVGKGRREPIPLSQRPLLSKITPGQFSLPVVSSSVTAFKVLRTVLKAQKPKIQFSGLENDAASLPSIRDSVPKNAIIVYHGQIFLSVRKSHCRRVRLQNSPSVSPCKQNQIKTPGCQVQLLLDTSHRPQQSKRQDVQTPVRDLDINVRISPLLHKASEEITEKCFTDKECQKEDESRSTRSPPKPLEDLESGQETSSSQPNLLRQSQIIHSSPVVSEPPEAAGGEREMHEDDNERLEGALLPRAESCLAFDFEQLAQEERINHLRARLRQKEAALSVFNAKPTDQI